MIMPTYAKVCQPMPKPHGIPCHMLCREGGMYIYTSPRRHGLCQGGRMGVCYADRFGIPSTGGI